MAAKDEVAAYHEVMQLCRTESPKLLKRVIDQAKASTDEKFVLAVANSIMDRAFGKAPQAVEVSGKVGFDEALMALLGMQADVGTTEAGDFASPGDVTH